MKIAIIGAGFTGLSAALALSKNNHEITVFEKDEYPGGLAMGYKESLWNWGLEKYYHHWFTNDKNAISLAREIRCEIVTKRPKTSVIADNHIYKFDSFFDVLTFPKLNMPDKLRMASVLGLLRYNPFWKPLEKVKAVDFLQRTMGNKAYSLLWEPQLKNKFGRYADDISLCWFWARIKKRTSSLSYPKGGFLEFAQKLVSEIKKRNGEFYFNTEVTEIRNVNHSGKRGTSASRILIRCWTSQSQHDGKEVKSKEQKFYFDKVIVTLPSFLFLKIAPQLPEDYRRRLQNLKGLGALNLILRLRQPFLKDGTYWLSVCNKNAPVMAVVEHTNFMDKKYYNNEHIVYLGNYLPNNHPYMKMSANELLKVYDPFLRKINQNYQLSIINYQLFKAPFAQPIISNNYSQLMPPFETPLKNVYLANIQQVYPWDRGTNYAIELGEKIAKIISRHC